MLNWLLQLLVFGILTLALMTGVMYLFQDQLIFHPQPLTPANRALHQHAEVQLDVGDAQLHGWYLPEPTGRQPLLIYFGGNAEEISWNISWFRRHLNASLLMINYRGFGASSGRPSETTMKRDALAIYDYARSQLGIAPSRVILTGRSLGSGVAAWLASQRPVAGLVLITPYDSLAKLAQAHYPFLPVGPLIRHRFDSDQLAPQIEVPMLSLTAGADRVVPPVHAQRLADRWKGPVIRSHFPDRNHININEVPGYWQAIARFIDSIGSRASAKEAVAEPENNSAP